MSKTDLMPSVLAFSKKLVLSDALLSGCAWDKRKESTIPLTLIEKSIRGTISNRLKETLANDPAKLNAEVEKPNIQLIDSCALSADQDTLVMNFTLKVLGALRLPSACNKQDFSTIYAQHVDKYISEYSCLELANRYAQNLANARFLWRNRLGSEMIHVSVKAISVPQIPAWEFDSMQFSTRNFELNNVAADQVSQVQTLSEHIATALSSDNDFLLLDITCYAKVGKSQEVYPSEELVSDRTKSKTKKSKKSKILYSVNNVAALHSQKIGNAIRTIDTWYPDFNKVDATVGPIAIEPYGAVTNLGKAFRAPACKQDFYTLLDAFVGDKNSLKPEDLHYLMAVFIRGGVFGKSERK